MNFSQLSFLAVLQGISEFLPISSSGHLAFFSHLFGLDERQALQIGLSLHLGTLVAVVLFLRRPLAALLKGAAAELKEKRYGARLRFLGLIALANLPAAAVGLMFKDQVLLFYKHLPLLAGLFFVMGMLLLLTRFLGHGGRGNGAAAKEQAELSWQKAFLIGSAQALALLPGISRAGATVCAALFLKVRRQEAASFSFLISLPAITGAFLLELNSSVLADEALLLQLWGFLIAFLTGMAALRLIFYLVEKELLYVFSFYLFLFSAVVLYFGLL